jgi:hypothetical protein
MLGCRARLKRLTIISSPHSDLAPIPLSRLIDKRQEVRRYKRIRGWCHDDLAAVDRILVEAA